MTGLSELWTLGGLSLPALLRRTVRQTWKDAVFGQSSRMAFYHFLAIFPALLVLLSISAHIPPVGNQIVSSLHNISSQVLPDQAGQMFRQMVDELNQRGLGGWQLLSVCAGAAWAAHNGTYALVYGLNTAYDVKESRSWRELAITIVSLTLCLAVIGFAAMFLLLFGLRRHRYLEWAVVVTALSLSFELIYRYAPSLKDREWRWSTPGALFAIILWLGATIGMRLYFAHVNNYARSYGHLNGVVMFLLWLYLTNGSILVGGEMNSEIEKAAEQRSKG
jgi:membrane protein